MNDKFRNRIITRKTIIRLLFMILISPVLVLFTMKVGWWLEPSKELSMVLINKSVSSSDGQENSAPFWILENLKYLKIGGIPYSPAKDYYGILPSGEGKYLVQDLSTTDSAQVDSLSNSSNLVYYVDTYGVYQEKAIKSQAQTVTSTHELLYGGLTNKDVEFLKEAKQKGKSIVAEFNILGLPTSSETRHNFEREFGIEWTGWAGRYYVSLDKDTGELPAWLVSGYEKQYETRWNFTASGVVLTHEDGRMLVLAQGEDLKKAVPVIHTFGYGRDSLGMVKTIDFGHWFDIVRYNDSINHAISAYELDVTDKGYEQLTRNGLPSRFPAVIMHHASDYRFYYLCGDYGNVQIVPHLARFKGSYLLGNLWPDRNNKRGGDALFYRFYVPLVNGILKQSYQTGMDELSGNKQIHIEKY